MGELGTDARFPTADMRFSDLVSRWRDECLPNKSISTRNGYLKIVKCHLSPFFDPYNLRDLSTSVIQRFVQTRIERGMKTQTVRNAYNTLRAILKHSKRLKFLKENPADGVELPARNDSTERVTISPENVLKLAQCFRERNDRRSEAIVFCAYLTGLRLGEISGLKWRDVDFFSDEIRPRQAVWHGQECTLKSKASYKPLPLSPKLKELLLSMRGPAGDEGFVFAPKSGKPIDLACWSLKTLYPAQSKLGIPKVTLHGFRHSHSTQLNALGVDPKTLQSQLRHAHAEITLSRYTHQLPEVQKVAVSKLEEQLLASSTKTCVPAVCN